MERLRIAQIAPPLERVPPRAYGGTERVMWELASELVRRGHEVTTFASGDSEVPGKLVPTVPAALRPGGFGGDPSLHFIATIQAVLNRAHEFDLIHSHLEWWSLLLARSSPVPVVSTFHGRLDMDESSRLLIDPPPGLVAISRSQASAHPSVPWTIIHNGLSLEGARFERRAGDGLAFVGRIDPEKGVIEAIEIARESGRPLKIAAKVGTLPDQVAYYESVFRPALAAAGSAVEFLGELEPHERDRLLAESGATLMPGAWPEPFGLVAIESLACGTPVLGRRVGALPEIIREGVDGYFGDDVSHMVFLLDRIAGLDRVAIRDSVLDRFSAGRMTNAYEGLYDRARTRRRTPGSDDLRRADPRLPSPRLPSLPSILTSGMTSNGFSPAGRAGRDGGRQGSARADLNPESAGGRSRSRP
jgi:glycosyltransferase involved in cell wall biosynthesis